MKIGVIGVGRLGICFALLLEKAGYEVFGSDVREYYIEKLKNKQLVTNEPVVADMLVEAKNITFTTGNRQVIEESDIIYIMVATPSYPDGSYDVRSVWNAINEMLESDKDLTGKIVVVGCTVNPGDCQKIQDGVRHLGVHVLYNPEFIAQGKIIHDLQHADMVLIGGEDQAAMDKYAKIYNDIQVTPPRINTMSLSAAELTKIAINCYLTTKISYANLVGEVMIKSGLRKDVNKVLKAIGEDTRIGPKYMNFGYGYGGPCLPRDNRAFAHYASSIGIDFNLGQVSDSFNKEHAKFLKNYVMTANPEKIVPFYMNSITYKPNTDILEESQQLILCKDLLDEGYSVYVEPHHMLLDSLIAELGNKYGDRIRFVSLEQLKQNKELYFEIEI